MNSWKAFSASCSLWKRFPAKSCQDAWRSGSQLDMADEAKLHSPVCSTFEVLVQSGIMEKNWTLSVEQCWLQALQFFMHLMDWLSILLSCNGFAGIQKAVVDQTSSRPPVTMTFFWCKFGFGKCFGVSWSNHWAGHHRFSYKIHFHYTSQSN